MYRSILVPLDGSSFAEEALPLALKIAELADSLEIMQVHEVYGVRDAYYSWSPYNPEVEAMLMERERAYLEAIVCRLQKNSAVPVTSYLTENLIEDGILERVRTKPADLIVMATHGRGPMSRFWLGSVADALVPACPGPDPAGASQGDLCGPRVEAHDSTHTNSSGRIEVGGDRARTGDRIRRLAGRRVHAAASRPRRFPSPWRAASGKTRRTGAIPACE